VQSAYRHILCPTDFSEASEAPVQEALRLRELWDARLTVLHIIHETALDQEEEDEEMRAFYAELQSRAEERMARLVPPARRDSVSCVIQRGEPIREILRNVVSEEIDLVVIGSHGMSGVESHPFGSTGRAVVLLSPVPILVVKPEGYDPRLAAQNP
jgi:nucleotide-binding universal stress UspA family protein